MSEIVAVPGAELVGTLPPPLEKTISFSAAVLTGASDVRAARALIAYLTEPAAGQALAANGFETPQGSKK